jgi:hypothetical protein
MVTLRHKDRRSTERSAKFVELPTIPPPFVPTSYPVVPALPKLHGNARKLGVSDGDRTLHFETKAPAFSGAYGFWTLSAS